MTDITGTYDSFDEGTKRELVIWTVAADGTLTAGLDGAALHGSYHENGSVKAIWFSTQRPTNPPQIVRFFYSGQVQADPQGAWVGMSGFYHYTAWDVGFHLAQTPWFAIRTGPVPPS